MPRQKRTEAKPALSAENLPEITPKQLAFVRGILEGKTASDAYRGAYNAQNMANDDIWREASLLRHHPKVSQWLSALRQANMDTGKLTLEGHMAELASLRDIAVTTGNVGAAVLAETNRGKVSGLYTDRIEDVTKRQDDVKSLVSRITQIDPIAGASLARALGIAAPDVVPGDEGEQPVTH